MARRAAKGVNERLHVVITRVSPDRVYEGRDAQRVACIGHGAGVHARSRQNERKKNSVPRRQRGQTDVSSLRDHREARSSRSSCVRTGREPGRREKFYGPSPPPRHHPISSRSADWHR